MGIKIQGFGSVIDSKSNPRGLSSSTKTCVEKNFFFFIRENLYVFLYAFIRPGTLLKSTFTFQKKKIFFSTQVIFLGLKIQGFGLVIDSKSNPWGLGSSTKTCVEKKKIFFFFIRESRFLQGKMAKSLIKNFPYKKN